MNILNDIYMDMSTAERRKLRETLALKGIIENTFQYDRRRQWHGTIPVNRAYIYANVLNISPNKFLLTKAIAGKLENIAERAGLLRPT